jgi:cytidylate kinase
MSHIQIAVDGPAGAGKSTIAKLIAKELNYIYVDTGAMYRAITLKAIKLHIDLSDDTKYDFIDDTKFEFIDDLLYMDDTNVEHEIREAIITNNVSLVSSHLSVRERLVQRQFDMAQNNNVVMDGRDIGYKVLPNARFKFFLTASIEERANRRHKENVSRNIKSDIHVIEEEIKRRDHFDQTRKHSPLRPADDAEIIDTSHLTINEVVSLITEKIREEV